MSKNKAFTLIEVVIAITFTTVVITAVTGLILTTLFANQRNLYRLQATYLAQESIEAVRYMRDTNWLRNYSWNGNPTEWGTSFDLGTDTPVDTSLELYLKEEDCPPCFSFTTFEEEGTVTTDNGYVFTRILSFTPVPDSSDPTKSLNDIVEVTATVSWQERGFTRSVELSTYLSNWQ